MSQADRGMNNGTPFYGQGKMYARKKTWQATDNPTESQLASNIIPCVGINNIKNKCVLFVDGNLWYRPNGQGFIVPVGINGAAVDFGAPYVFN